MNGRMIAITVAALAAAGIPSWPAVAPPASPEAQAELAASLPHPQPKGRSPLRTSSAERHCLALNVYWESRGQPQAGQAAVAHVTLNRVGNADFPDTICGVVTQSAGAGICQFGWWCTARHRMPPEGADWGEAQAVAARVLAGAADPTGGALYFHHVNERPRFAIGRYAGPVRIGAHVFFRLAEKPAAKVVVRH